jgi:hypothetical protein
VAGERGRLSGVVLHDRHAERGQLKRAVHGVPGDQVDAAGLDLQRRRRGVGVVQQKQEARAFPRPPGRLDELRRLGHHRRHVGHLRRTQQLARGGTAHAVNCSLTCPIMGRELIGSARGRVSSQTDGARLGEAEDALDAAEFAFGA